MQFLKISPTLPVSYGFFNLFVFVEADWDSGFNIQANLLELTL
jgi:hypothetical protein